MPKGVEKDALSNWNAGRTASGNLLDNSQNIYGSLEPMLQAQAAHPSGYTPAQKAAINTAAQQSAGGSNAGAVGAGGLYAARTRNAGAGQTAIGNAIRSSGQNLSNAAVNTAVQDANLAQKNRNAALGGLSGLYGTDVSGGLNALNSSTQALNTANQAAANNPWLKLMQSAMAAGGQVGAAALER